MPRFTIKSKKDAELLLYLDEGKEIRRMISIGNPGSHPPTGSSRVEKVLRLEFDDTDKHTTKSPTKAHILKIINFAQELQKENYNGILLIHCDAGVSRSTATAYIVNCVWWGPGKEAEALERIYRDRPTAYPNDLMVKLADELLDRKHAMVAALNQNPYGPEFRYPGLFGRIRSGTID